MQQTIFIERPYQVLANGSLLLGERLLVQLLEEIVIERLGRGIREGLLFSTLWQTIKFVVGDVVFVAVVTLDKVLIGLVSALLAVVSTLLVVGCCL